jgi:hypothetical protein
MTESRTQRQSRRLREAAAEIGRLRADLETYMRIANTEANEAERLRGLVAFGTDTDAYHKLEADNKRLRADIKSMNAASFEKDAEISRLRCLLAYGNDTDAYHKLEAENEQLIDENARLRDALEVMSVDLKAQRRLYLRASAAWQAELEAAKGVDRRATAERNAPLTEQSEQAPDNRL